MSDKKKKSDTKDKNLTKKEKFERVIYNEIFIVIGIVLIIILIIGGFVYYKTNSGKIYVERASIVAPLISLKPSMPGILDKVFVKIGDHVLINSIVAQVGNKEIITKTDGVITYVDNVPGQYMTPQNTVVQMYNPEELRVVGQVQENKGLKEVHAGEKVVFTADAFGSKKYQGTIEEVSPTSRASDIVFSISDKREEQYFDVIAEFDIGQHLELKNGMSAKMWIYT